MLAKITPNSRGEGNPTSDDQEQLGHTAYDWFLCHRPRTKQSDIIHSIPNKRCQQLLAKQLLANGAGFELPSRWLGLGLHRDCTGAALRMYWGYAGAVVGWQTGSLAGWRTRWKASTQTGAQTSSDCTGTALGQCWGCAGTVLGLYCGRTGPVLGLHWDCT